MKNETKPDDYIYTAIDAMDEVYYGKALKSSSEPLLTKDHGDKWVKVAIIMLMTLLVLGFVFFS